MQHVLVDGLCATCQPVLRAFNPSEPRIPGGEHGGEWGHGFGHALEDELQLAGRIHLDPGEQLVSSSRLDNSSGADVDLLFAVIHSPYGNEVRIGAIPSDDAGKWTAEAKGATAGLASDELRQARTDIAAGAAAADKAASAAAAAWKSGHAPTDPKMLGAEPVASGTLGSHGNHDELDWKIYVNDQSSWDLSITATRGEFNGAVLDPTETGDLLTHLGDIQGQLDYSGHSAVAPVQRSISLDRHVLVDGECTTCRRSQSIVDEPPQHLHVLDNGICTTCDADVQRNFNPSEPRIPGGEHGGEWGSGGAVGSALKDALKLGGRIQLGKDEKFTGSGKVRDKNGDMSAVLAGIDSPSGRKVRLGLVLPEHERDWRAADKGGTVELDKHGVAQLSETLSGAAEAGRDSVKSYYADVRKAHAAKLHDHEWPDPEAEIASGTIRAGWGNLKWTLQRDADTGPEIPGIDAPGAGWSLGLQIVPDSGAVQGVDPMSIDSAAKTKALQSLLAELAAA